MILSQNILMKPIGRMSLFSVRSALVSHTTGGFGCFEHPRQTQLRSIHDTRASREGIRIRDTTHGKPLLGLYEKLKPLGDGEVRLSSVSNSLAELTFANPSKKNALSGRMMVHLGKIGGKRLENRKYIQ